MKRGIAVIVTALVVLGSYSASAHVGPSKKLRLDTSDTGSAQWQRNRQDSPLDTNASRLKLAVAEQNGDDYALAYAKGTGIDRRLASRVRNLSFDFRNTSYVGAGAPRISVEINTDGDLETEIYAYLSAFYCNTQIGASDWSRADFTGQTAVGCAFYTSQGNLYASDGTQSAWDAFEDALPAGAGVQQAYVVMDEVGQSFIDRLAFQNHMFVRQGKGAGAIKHCPTEASC